MRASRENFPLLDELLAEQNRLETPVARFAGAHAGEALSFVPVYRDLIPLSAPRTGEQYAFEVELDSCTGCKACVSACHSLNGLDDTETWRDVGLVVGGDWRDSFQQTVTTACHHCADPACLNGCPVLAYEKDPVTGIVRHLDDQCIGCQYCILKCPYDVPKYNARLGIVRKCDMCHGRLAEGEAPACVQACPTHAIRIVTVPVAAAPASPIERVTQYVTFSKPDLTTNMSAFLSAAPAPDYTQPTTRYLSRRSQPANLRAADAGKLRPQPAHWPLALALTFLPLAIGCHLLAAVMQARLPASSGNESVTYYVTLLGWLAGAIGLGVSATHLGKPLRAWRIFLGWRKSWLSREAMVLGGWMAVATGALVWREWVIVAAGVGVFGLFCSAMIYIDTRRRFWRATQTLPRLFGAVIAFGGAVAICFGVAPEIGAAVLAAGVLVKLACDARAVRPVTEADDDAEPTGPLKTARLLTGKLRLLFGTRVVVSLVAGLLMPAMIVTGVLPYELCWGMLGCLFVGELLERHLFFRAVDAPKMPGLPA